MGVDDHPGAVQLEPGLDQQGLVDGEAAAALDGVQVQGGQGAVRGRSSCAGVEEWGWQGVDFLGGPQARNSQLTPAGGFAFARAADGTRCLQSGQ